MTYVDWLATIIRQLLNIIPAERGYRLEEEPVTYGVSDEIPDLNHLPTSIPLP